MSDWDEPEAQYQAEHPRRRFSENWWRWMMVASALVAILPLAQYGQVAAMGGPDKYCVNYYSSAGTETSTGTNVVPGVTCYGGQPQYVGMWLFWIALALFLIALCALLYRRVSRRRIR
jgi:hypothetical protein